MSQPIEQDKLELLRKPFAPNQISKLPKPTKKQTDDVKADYKKGIRCGACGTWHHPEVVHLDYVGHAALTDRLLEVDLHWTWRPLALSPGGLPLFDISGGLWIELTVLGLTRLGYGHAAESQYKEPGAREKEVIGDALRNAAMRFGCALDLWHKGDLHLDRDEPTKPQDAPQSTQSTGTKAHIEKAYQRVVEAKDQKKANEYDASQQRGAVTDYAEGLPFDGPVERPAALATKTDLWIFPGGKFKGKALNEVDLDEAKNYLGWLEGEAGKKREKLKGWAKEFQQQFHEYTGGRI